MRRRFFFLDEYSPALILDMMISETKIARSKKSLARKIATRASSGTQDDLTQTTIPETKTTQSDSEDAPARERVFEIK